MRNQKGVSLITLIITIIVVIILAIIILRSGASDAPTQAQFSGFTSEMGDLQDAVRAAMLTAKGSEATKGNNRTDAQLYNFIARGGYEVLSGDSGDSMWLVQDDAKKIPCTLINKEHAEESIGTKLPVRKVETYYGTSQQVSYFVTPKGNVFCWPPYVYDGKSYVNADLALDYDKVEATNPATESGLITIEFANEEKVTVSNVAGTTADHPFVRTQGTTAAAEGTPSVWYSEDLREPATDASGVAVGYTFFTYDNTVNP